MMHNQPEIDVIRDIIVRTAAPERVYLFGSYAYGTPDQDSDYDFYVLVPDSVKSPGMVTDDIYRALYKKTNQKPVDILVKRTTDFEKRKHLPTMEREVYTKGVILYGNA